MSDISRRLRNVGRQFRKKMSDVRENTPEYQRLRTEQRSIGYKRAYERYVIHFALHIWLSLIGGVIVGTVGGIYLVEFIYSIKIDIISFTIFIIIAGAVLGASIVYWSINIWYRFQRKRNR